MTKWWNEYLVVVWICDIYETLTVSTVSTAKQNCFRWMLHKFCSIKKFYDKGEMKGEEGRNLDLLCVLDFVLIAGMWWLEDLCSLANLCMWVPKYQERYQGHGITNILDFCNKLLILNLLSSFKFSKYGYSCIQIHCQDLWYKKLVFHILVSRWPLKMTEI